ncbi:MAG: tetratricopeptide repeat protein [Alphaproteobacteria bacterium]|nr:tetratricopeptide repeat protein [Alphaproteobacteria bacterium]
MDLNAVDWNTWGPPLFVMVLGLFAGLVLVMRSGGRLRGEDARAELEAKREVVMTRLRALEADKDKLDPEAYASRKQALVTEAAGLLRALEEGPPEADESAEAPAASGNPGRMLPWAIGLVLFFGVTAYSLQQAAQPRRDGASMTGNQDLGGGAMAADPEVAAALARLESDPQDLEALNLLTRVALQMNDLQSAMGFLNTARQVAPDDPGVLTHVAALNLVINRLDESQTQLERALSLRPGFPEARIWLALVYGNRGEWEAAGAELEGVVADPQAGARDVAEAQGLLASLKMAQARQATAAAGGPQGGPPSDGSPPAEAGPPVVSGQVVAVGDIAPGGVLFVYARASDATRGPPLAAKRITDWSLPLEFSLSASDLVFGGEFPEQFWVHAKISRSGDPMVRSDDDVLSATVGPLSPGSEAVEIRLGE